MEDRATTRKGNSMTQYRFTWDCPRCDKRAETFGIAPTRVHCGDCLMDRTEVVLMRIKNVEPLPDEPMVNIKVVGPNGEPIEGES